MTQPPTSGSSPTGGPQGQSGNIRTVWTDPWGMDPRTGRPVRQPGSGDAPAPGPGPRPSARAQLGDDATDDW